MTNRCTQAFCAATEMYPGLHVSGCYSLLLSTSGDHPWRRLHVNEEGKREEKIVAKIGKKIVAAVSRPCLRLQLRYHGTKY